jgi:hypothetical protein
MSSFRVSRRTGPRQILSAGCGSLLCLWSFLYSPPELVAVPNGNATTTEALNWKDIREFDVEGRGWNDTKAFYDRLPARAESLVRPEVWNLSRQSAGLQVRFVSDATSISARWALTSANLAMPNMAALGCSGLDLYVRTEQGGWRWLGVGQPKAQTNAATLISGMPPGEREYLLYLPLFNDPEFVQLGVPTNSTLRKAGPWGSGERKPIVFYGTSILQGLGAERPGLVHSAILGRRFNWPTINLGFSGHGRMEPELADLLAELDPSVYVLDCLPNMNAEQVTERVEPFVAKLRSAHPQTPILLVEDRVYANAFLMPNRATFHAANHAALRSAFERLQKSGVKNLYYLPADQLFGDDGEWTVDGSHPNALGFMRQADAFAKVLGPLLQSP